MDGVAEAVVEDYIAQARVAPVPADEDGWERVQHGKQKKSDAGQSAAEPATAEEMATATEPVLPVHQTPNSHRRRTSTTRSVSRATIPDVPVNTAVEAWGDLRHAPDATKHRRGQLGQTYEVPQPVAAASTHLHSLGYSSLEALSQGHVLPHMLQGVAPAAVMLKVEEINATAETRQMQWLRHEQSKVAHRAREDHSCPPASSATTASVVDQAIQESQAMQGFRVTEADPTIP